MEYEGEYLNMKKNGKGKEYYESNGQLLYEGEYLNDKKNGEGKEYFLDGKIKFVGIFLNGKMWDGKGYYKGLEDFKLTQGNGYIKYYNSINNKILFEGEYKNGEKTGRVKEYYNGELRFDGEYLNGKKNGKVKEYKESKLIFEGGVEYFDDGNMKFKGEYLKDKMWNGKVYDNENNSFILINGKGKIKVFNKEGEVIFKGEYENGEKNGKGREYFKGKLIYEGIYSKGKKVKYGKGREYNDFKEIIFEGEYFDGLRNGKGREYDEDGNLIYEGDYKNGLRNGKGKEYNNIGEIIFEGEYSNGNRK